MILPRLLGNDRRGVIFFAARAPARRSHGVWTPDERESFPWLGLAMAKG
jgi:hypothetical protein